jgi:hypothetical protein
MCSRKRAVIDKMSETGLSQGFLFSGSDAVSGCGYFLSDWIRFEKVTETIVTVGC